MKIDTDLERDSSWAAHALAELLGSDGHRQGPLWSTWLGADMPRLNSPVAQVWAAPMTRENQ